MLLRTNIDLFKTIKALAGVNDFTTEENADLVAFAERRLSMAYNTSPMWDRYVVVSEERHLSSFIVGEGLSDSTYENQPYYKYGEDSNGDAVYVPVNQSLSTQQTVAFTFNNTTKKWLWGLSTYSKDASTKVVTVSTLAFATQQDTDERDSPIDVVDWGTLNTITGNLRITAAQIAAYSETFEVLSHGATRTSKTTINDFIRIHRDQSFLNNSSVEYQFFVDSNGANVLNAQNTDEVYVTYKKPIANQTTGQIITSVDGSGNRTLNSSGSEIPSEFFNYTAHGVYADFLRMDGQHDKAAFEEQKADMFLATELERIDIINNNNSLNHKFSTYVNTSSR